MLQPNGYRLPTPATQTCHMSVISTWNVNDKPEGRLEAALEFVVVWAVHLQRSYRMIRGATKA